MNVNADKYWKTPTRRGASLFLALACLAIVSLLMGSAFHSTVLQTKQERVLERRLQAQWLAESGVDRACALLTQNPAYAGEEWRVPADEIGGRDAGAVRIRVATLADNSRARRIEVVARFPVDRPMESTASRETVFTLPEKSKSP